MLCDWNNDEPSDPVLLTFGCRIPQTALGSWDGAFVYAETKQVRISAVFQNGMDYVGHPNNLVDELRKYKKFIKQGWIPMTRQDIEKTAGIQIDVNTNRDVPTWYSQYWQRIVVGCAVFLFILYL